MLLAVIFSCTVRLLHLPFTAFSALRKNLTVPQVLLGFGENAAPVLRWLDAADSLPSQV